MVRAEVFLVQRGNTQSLFEIVSLGFLCQSLLGPKQYFPAVAFVLLTMEAAGVDVEQSPDDCRRRFSENSQSNDWWTHGMAAEWAALRRRSAAQLLKGQQRRSSPVRPDADAQLLEEEAATCCRILSGASGNCTGQVKQNLQGCCVPTATALSHH